MQLIFNTVLGSAEVLLCCLFLTEVVVRQLYYYAANFKESAPSIDGVVAQPRSYEANLFSGN